MKNIKTHTLLLLISIGIVSCDLNEGLNDSVTKEESNEILGATEGLTTAYDLLRTFQTIDTNVPLQ